MEHNKNLNMTISLAEIFYYIFFLLLLGAKCIGLYDGQPTFKVLLVLAMAAWAIKIFLTDFTIREFVGVLLLLGLGVLVYLRSGEKGALLYIFMITGLKNVPVKRVFAVGAAAWSAIFLLFTWLNALHILESPFKVHDKFGLGPVIRWGLGYSHPNVLHVSYLVLVMFLVYVMGEKYSWKHALGLMIGNALIFVYSLSSTGVIAVTFYLGLTLYGRYRKQLNVLEKILIQAVLPVCVLFSLLAPLVLQGRAFEIADKLTNTRLSLAKYFLNLRLPTLFGVRVEEIITNKLTMDNSYVNAFVTYGIVLFILIVFTYCILIYKCCKEQKKEKLCIILTCLVAGITEPFLFNTSFKNISLLFMQDILFCDRRVEKIYFSKYASKKITLSTGKIQEWLSEGINQIRQKKKILIYVGVLGCVLGSGAYHVIKQEPTRIFVPQSYCDYDVIHAMSEELTTILLPSASEVAMVGNAVYQYVDAQTEMAVFEGNFVRIEHVRNMICCGITGAFVVMLLMIAFACFKKKKG